MRVGQLGGEIDLEGGVKVTRSVGHANHEVRARLVPLLLQNGLLWNETKSINKKEVENKITKSFVRKPASIKRYQNRVKLFANVLQQQRCANHEAAFQHARKVLVRQLGDLELPRLLHVLDPLVG